ncbi:MAG: Ig-like domain-containing protein, partial [Shewanella sp.]
YTPGEFRGVDQFSYLISDSRGGYDLATITVHVTDSTPQAPAKPSLAAYPQTFTLEQGQSQRVDLTASVASSNIDSWALTQVQDNSGLGVVSDKTASAFTYLGQSPGVANIGYTVQGSGLTATSEVIVVINAPPQPDNTPPNANNVMLDTVNNRNVKVDLLNYINDEDGDTLNITQLISASGRFSLNGSLVTFAPNGFVGVDQAVYSVEDGKGGYALGHIVATSMDANPPVPNTPPTANDLDKAIDVATLPVWDIDLSALKLIADADGDALKIVNVYSTDNRAVKQADTRISYTPGAFRGVDQFTYVITDSKNGFAIGVVTVAVNDSTPGNIIPTAEAVEGHMLDNDPMITLSVADKVHDADGDALQIVSITGALGKATVNPANSLEILYEPNGIVGVDSFVYTVSDGRGGHAMAAVTVKVTHHNPTAPVAGVITAETLLDTPVTIDLSTVISDNETPTPD